MYENTVIIVCVAPEIGDTATYPAEFLHLRVKTEIIFLGLVAGCGLMSYTKMPSQTRKGAMCHEGSFRLFNFNHTC